MKNERQTVCLKMFRKRWMLFVFTMISCCQCLIGIVPILYSSFNKNIMIIAWLVYVFLSVGAYILFCSMLNIVEETYPPIMTKDTLKRLKRHINTFIHNEEKSLASIDELVISI